MRDDGLGSFCAILTAGMLMGFVPALRPVALWTVLAVLVAMPVVATIQALREKL